MSTPYRIFGAEISPYSVKVRSYFRYKGIPHEWIVRSPATQAEFQKYAKLPLVPAVATPEDEGLQDSTPILEAMEARFPEPSIHPPDPALAFVSALLEEFGDEWGNKWMFHLRWARPADQQSAGERLARMMAPDADGEALEGAIGMIVGRMTKRVWFVGSNPQTAPQIEKSFEDGVALLDAHLAERPFLFGGRPAFGDFGLWGQVYSAWTDPTAGAILRDRAPRVVSWVERMLDPKAEGPFQAWDDLAPTLMPLLRDQVGGLRAPGPRSRRSTTRAPWPRCASATPRSATRPPWTRSWSRRIACVGSGDDAARRHRRLRQAGLPHVHRGRAGPGCAGARGRCVDGLHPGRSGLPRRDGVPARRHRAGAILAPPD
jgi:glutathione S-transferase